ncbi:hypothetical protein BC834DRAFT_890716 [Gloeopeniophorella convolvens]|nr:hypothetical protein BC834DRAFT_890716 [Gloeopeniophorella convolvens]
MLVDRSLEFRGDFFTAQFCHASLAQFAILQSRDDFLPMHLVDPLSRIFVNMEAGEEEDVRFWTSRQSRGISGAELSMGVEELRSLVLRNGPLSNFSRLGGLTLDLIQKGNGESTSEDIQRTFRLLEKMLGSTILPLGGASPRIWSHFEHFRNTVRSAAASARGRNSLQRLLEMVNQADTLACAGSYKVSSGSIDDVSEDSVGPALAPEPGDLPGPPASLSRGSPHLLPNSSMISPIRDPGRPRRSVRFADDHIPPSVTAPQRVPGAWEGDPSPADPSHGRALADTPDAP